MAYYLTTVGYKNKKRKPETRKQLKTLAEKLGCIDTNKLKIKNRIEYFNCLNGDKKILVKNNFLAVFEGTNPAFKFLREATYVENTKRFCLDNIGDKY